MQALVEQPTPQHAHLLALGNAVGGHEGAAHRAAGRGLGGIGVGEQVAQAAVGIGTESHVLELLPAACRFGRDGAKSMGRFGKVASRFDVPARHVVQHTGAGNALCDGGEIGLLVLVLVLLAYERRIAEDER